MVPSYVVVDFMTWYAYLSTTKAVAVDNLVELATNEKDHKVVVMMMRDDIKEHKAPPVTLPYITTTTNTLTENCW